MSTFIPTNIFVRNLIENGLKPFSQKQSSNNNMSEKMHSPSISDLTSLKQILWYVKGIVSMGISTLDDTGCTIRAYSDSKWTVCTTTRHYTLGFYTFLAKTWSRGCRKRNQLYQKIPPRQSICHCLKQH